VGAADGVGFAPHRFLPLMVLCESTFVLLSCVGEKGLEEVDPSLCFLRIRRGGRGALQDRPRKQGHTFSAQQPAWLIILGSRALWITGLLPATVVRWYLDPAGQH
jgi:hypothetical protein